jgi:hypothetical protein
MGKEVDRAGRYIALEEPDHRTLDTFGAKEFLAYPGIDPLPNDERRSWKSVVWHPKLPNELAYNPTPSPNNTAVNRYHIGLLIDGASPFSAFEFEVFHLFEGIGRIITNPTPSFADDGVFSRIQGVTSDLIGDVVDRISGADPARVASFASKLLNIAYRGADIYTRGAARQRVLALN